MVRNREGNELLKAQDRVMHRFFYVAVVRREAGDSSGTQRKWNIRYW
jgi:hypothetical protein